MTRPRRIEDCVWEWAARTPDAVAVSDGQRALSYRALADQAEALSERLRAAGAGPEVLVALSGERSAELIVALVAILRSGAAYVPIDPAYPPARRAFLLEDSRADIVLTDRRHRADFADTPASVIVWDDETLDQMTPRVSPPKVDDPLAYVIYTSGSTGKPKGVLVTQRNVVRLFEQIQPWFGFDKTDVWSLFHSFAFDFSVFEIWGALLHGGRLVVVPYEVTRDPVGFRSLVRKERISVLSQTPSAFRMFMRADALIEPTGADALRHVVFGGEALDLRSLRPWFDRHGDSQPVLVNMYGITETTVHVTYRGLTRQDADEPRSLIGAPIPDLTLHVLDPDGVPAAGDNAGELWVGGAGVARGYLRRDDLTAERFVPDRFSLDPRARLYRTGDLVRRGRDGELEYLGRIDQQVKLRGFRIELGEIETALRAFPGVTDAAVLLHQDGTGEAALLAYVAAPAALDIGAVSAQLARELPEHMCPRAIVQAPALPLTEHGKLDREALLALTSPKPVPAAPAEQDTVVRLAAVFGEILGISAPGADANFFGVGGTSLQAMMLSLRIAERFGVVLPPGTVFHRPVLSELAEAIESAGRYAPEMTAAPAENSGWSPQSFAQEQFWIVQMLDPKSCALHCPAAFRIVGDLDAVRLSGAIERACLRHAALRTIFDVKDGRPVQKVAPYPTFQLVTRQNSLDPQSATKEALEQSLDLSRSAGSATLIEISEREHVLVLVLHHLVTDGWSLSRLINEIVRDYAGAEIDRPQLEYVDLAARHRGQMERGELEESARYWREELGDAPTINTLPELFPRPAEASFRRGRVAFRLPDELGSRISRMAQDRNLTPNSILLAGFAALIHRYSSQPDLVLGVPYANRDQPGAEAIQGLLMNLLPLRVRFEEGVSFGTFASNVALRSGVGYAHGGVPFSRIVRDLAIKREIGRQPLVQCVFAPQAGPRNALTLGGCDTEVIEPELGTTFYDLTLCIWPSGNGSDAELIYAADLYSDELIQGFRDQFLRLLESVVDDADQSVADLSILSPAERDRLLIEWSGHAQLALQQAPPTPFLDHFRRVAAKFASTEAIRYGDESVTYRELDAWSNRIAHALTARGVGKDSLTGIACPRSPVALAAILGTWKAGAAYVPLDPSYPQERLRWMLQDSGASLLLTTAQCNLLFDDDIARVLLDEAIVSLDAAPTEVSGDLDALAYVIYTSGSTGIPKGVMVEQRGVAALTACILENYPLSPGARILQYAPLSFDVSVGDILSALAQGATLVIPAQSHMLAGAELLDLLESERIAQTLLPMSVLAQLEPRPLPHLIRLVSGGERCPSSLADRWALGRVFVNAYGPTEASVGASLYRCSPGEGDPPIGQPLPGWTLYVLDANGRLAPPLAPGELYIGGNGVARGYLGRPDLTRERFIDGMPDIDERLYRTSDRVRWRGDGNLEFLGRIDDQLKIRGFRIELGEVEAALQAHPAVHAAVATVEGDGPTARLIAYAVPRVRGSDIDRFTAEILAQLREKLPAQLVPSEILVVNRLPLMPNGKVDRAALRRPKPSPPSATLGTHRDEVLVGEIWRDVLGKPVATDVNFFDAGGTSLQLVEIQARLEARTSMRTPLADLFAHPTIEAMAHLVAGRAVSDLPTTVPALSTNEPIAIVGIAARFPKAPDVAAFWNNLRDGIEGISRFSAAELLDAGIAEAALAHPDYIRARGIIEAEEEFDAALFEMGAHEAERTDPQQRVWLECALAALEDAGCDPHRFTGQIGMFAGVGAPSYLLKWAAARGESPEDDYLLGLGNDKDFVATRASYKLGLRGPSLTVQTACSTSLVAVHIACQQLLSGECDLAVAGAASLSIPATAGYLFKEGMILSRDGHCRPFDARANGTVPGDGVGAVVLKRLRDAIADGDAIHALIAGTAVNNDGAAKVGYTAPSVAGQKQVITKALARAGLSARDVSFVEAHGTGTSMGDPIEFAALRQVFEEAGAVRAACGLGSVKSDLGHLNTAAGMASLIKTVLAIKHRTIPGTLHFTSPNPEIDLEHSPFFISATSRPWEVAGPLVAGVSSFGIGGTNAHVIVTEAPVSAPLPTGRGLEILPVSAATPQSLARLADQLAIHLQGEDLAITEVARTLQTGRTARAARRIVIAADCDDAARKFRRLACAPSDQVPLRVTGKPVATAFLFPGQGAQSAGLGSALATSEPRVREQFELAGTALKAETGVSLIEALNGSGAIDETSLTQPFLFTLEYALARALIDCGLRPAAMLGHSLGEYVAACLAQVFSFEDGLALVAERGRLMQSTPPGAMLSVPLPEAEVLAMLVGPLDLAVVNGPSHCVVSGDETAISSFARALEASGREGRRLRTKWGFHSRLLDAIEPKFRQALDRVRCNPPSIPYLSCLTGDWITTTVDTDYWLAQMRQPVRFHDAMTRLIAQATLMMEVGPGETLTSLARRHPDRSAAMAVIPTLGRVDASTGESERWLTAIGSAWCAGAAIEWNALRDRSGTSLTHLPTYPFDRKRYWGLPDPARRSRSDRDYLYAPVWRAAPDPVPDIKPRRWIVCAAAGKFGERLVSDLGEDTVIVRFGARFEQQSNREFVVRATSRADFTAVLEALADDSARGVIHALDEGYFSVVALVQALAAADLLDVQLNVVTFGGQAADGPTQNPAAAAVAPLLRVVSEEYPGFRCRVIDLDDGEAAADAALHEIRSAFDVPLVAVRNGLRSVRAHEPLSPSEPQSATRLRRNGVYIITGGLGGIGLTLAEHLAVTYGARLILVSRTGQVSGDGEEAGLRMAALTRVRAAASALIVETTDIADPDAARNVVQRALSAFGRLDGVIHSAGVTGGGALQRRSDAMAHEIFRAKVDGTLALDAALRDVPHDFLFLCSSLTALGGAFGQADYAAANAFLDAFAEKHNSPERRVVSVNWDGWREIGAYKRHAAAHLGATTDEAAAPLLSCAEGVRIFEICLNATRANLATSKRPLESRGAAIAPTAAAPRATSRHPRPALDVPCIAPRTDVEADLAEIWAEHFNLDTVGVDDDFFDLGGDSLLAVQVAHAIRVSLNREVPMHLLIENPTVAALAQHIASAETRGPKLRRNLVELAPGPSAVRPIFLVHPIGGHVYFYLPMAKQLTAIAPVYGLQAQGVDGEAPPLATIEEMASQYLAAIREVQPHGPYRLAGSSFGGVVCFDMAQQLAREGERTELLALIDSPTPSLQPNYLRTDAEILAYMLARGEDPSTHVRALSELSAEEMLGYFLSQGRDRLAPNANADSVRHFLRLFRANFAAMKRYEPRGQVARGMFFQATQHDVFATQGFGEGWLPHFADLGLIPVPGNHTSMNLPPNCDHIVRHIGLHLRKGEDRND